MNKMIEYSCSPFRYTELQSEFCVGDDDKTGKLNLHNVCNKHFVYPLSISVLQWGIQISHNHHLYVITADKSRQMFLLKHHCTFILSRSVDVDHRPNRGTACYNPHYIFKASGLISRVHFRECDSNPFLRHNHHPPPLIRTRS